jgi:hypothetical protein
MIENASLSDYLFELRRGAPRDRLGVAIFAGFALVIIGGILGPLYAGLTGLGCALIGISAWALLNQVADAMDGRFEGAQSSGARRIRLAGIAALGLAAVGTLLLLTSFFFRFILLTKGM